jgi:hypothetical protein
VLVAVGGRDVGVGEFGVSVGCTSGLEVGKEHPPSITMERISRKSTIFLFDLLFWWTMI